MNSIHAIPPKVGQTFIAVASDQSGAGVYRCIGDGLYLEFGEGEPQTDEGIMLEGSAWFPISCRAIDEWFDSKESDQ